MSNSFDEYQKLAAQYAVYPKEHATEYVFSGIGEEAGEVIGKRKKYLRGDVGSFEYNVGLHKELGDLLWYIAATATEHGMSLEDIANTNLQKLSKRKRNNTIRGNGDNR